MITYTLKATKNRTEKTFFAYEDKGLNNEIRSEKLRGFGQIVNGNAEQSYGTCDIKFVNYDQFVNFCSRNNVYMTKKGFCLYKKR